MRLETTRFGMLDIDEQTVITFTQPILGFQDCRRFVLLPGPAGGDLHWLQCTEDGALAFIVMDPRLVVPDYQVSLKAGELQELAVAAAEELDVYTLVVVPADRSQIRTNLRAPLLVNPTKRLAKQAILDQSDYPVQFFLAQAADGALAPNQEVSHARSDS
jgi:flagellar assembly factor FliW